MESSNKIYYYLHIGGALINDNDRNVEYKSGRWENISMDCGMTYHEFVAWSCEKMNIE